jgi:hypothetical protein
MQDFNPIIENNKQFKCIICNLEFSTKIIGKKHLKSKIHLQNVAKTLVCIYCSYATPHKKIYDNHIKSEKHNAKVASYDKDYDREFRCMYCNNIFFMKLSKFIAHQNECNTETKDTPPINKPNEEIPTTRTEIINEFKKLIIPVVDEIKQDLSDLKSTKIDTVQIKKMIREGVDESKLAKTSSALFNTLIKNHSNNPPLLTLSEDCSENLLHDTFKPKTKQIVKLSEPKDDKYLLQKQILKSYKNKTYIDDITNLILSQIKTNNINTQSIFISDISRLNYFIKLTVKDWHTDKKGIKIAEKVINPIMDIISKKLKEYYFNINEEEYSNLIELREDEIHLRELIKEIKDGKLGSQILIKIAPFLQYQNEEVRS